MKSYEKYLMQVGKVDKEFYYLMTKWDLKDLIDRKRLYSMSVSCYVIDSKYRYSKYKMGIIRSLNIREPIKMFVNKVIKSPDSFELTEEFDPALRETHTSLLDKETSFLVKITRREPVKTSIVSAPFDLTVDESNLITLTMDAYIKDKVLEKWAQDEENKRIEREKHRVADEQERDKWCKIYGVGGDD